MRYLRLYIIIILIISFIQGVAFSEEILTWQDCVKEAAKNNPDLISAQEVVKQSQAAKDITASGLYPQIDANLDASTGKTVTGSGSSAKKSTTDSYSYGLSGTQLIFDGLKTVDNVKAAGETVKANIEAFKFTSSNVRLGLRNAYVNLIRAQELVKVSEEIIKIRRSNLELITLRYESGLEHRGALLTAEANLALARFNLAQAKRDIELSQRQLNKEMGRKVFIPMFGKVDFTVDNPVDIKPDFELIAKSNPSLQEAINNRNSAAFGVKSAYANFFPQLTGSGSVTKSDNHWSPRNPGWNLGLGLTMPVFEGGLRIAQVSQAKALYNQLVAVERSTRDSIIVNLEQAWVNLRDSIETVGVQYQNLIATQERSKIAEAQYSIGLMSYDNWTIIEDNLVSAKTSYLNAQANALFAEASWIQAKGETLEYAQQKN
ncbi:MAG: TolC family protein [Candidatus Omnitrophica bacterium]|nr:TolC family protein [Candidatus Omnitrophota bacterium]